MKATKPKVTVPVKRKALTVEEKNVDPRGEEIAKRMTFP
jgi:hypothetical protein